MSSCRDKIKMEIWNSFEWKNNITNYPYTQSLEDEYIRAYSIHKKLSYNNTRTNHWKFLGPNNIAGRILSLAVNPKDTNILWAGSASAGLWKSESGGRGANAWTNIKLNFPVLAVSSIAIDPNDPDIIYIGTGESYSFENTDGGKHNRLMRGFWGIGILKSIDGGITWKESFNSSNNPFQCFWKIIVNPNNSKIIYASGTHGVFKSVNSGLSWQKVLDKKMAMDLVMHPNIPEILIAGVGGLGADDYGIFMSQNAGNNWNKITDGENPNGKGRIMLNMNKNFPQKVFALMSDSFKTKNLVRTNNLFSSFAIGSITNISSYQGWYAHGIISNSDGKELMIGGVDLFLDKSGNYNNFDRYHMGEIGLHADFHDIIANPMDESKLYFATDGGVYRSDDFGRTFYNCNQGLNTTQFYAGSFTKEGELGIGGLQDNRSAIFNGTDNWELTHYGDGVSSAINYSNPNISFCCSQNLILSKAEDRTFSWKTILQDETACFVTPFKMSPSNENYLYTASNILYRSTDNGLQFKKISNPPDSAFINSIEISPLDPEFILISTIPGSSLRPRLYKSIDGGKTLTNITSNLPDRIISDISIVNNNEYNICLTGFGTYHVYSTKNGGISWTQIDRKLPDIPLHTIWTSPFHPNLIFVGSDLGLYYTNDSGKNWSHYLLGQNDVLPVYDLFYTEKDFGLIVFTHSRGVYRIDPFDVITSTTSPDKAIEIKSYTSNNIPVEIQSLSGKLISISGHETKIERDQLINNLSNLQSGMYYFSSEKGTIKILNIY